jgi:broad specificity phosphatase PhoE
MRELPRETPPQSQPTFTLFLPQPIQLTPNKGQTEWTISGQCTGSTDIPLTAVGESQVIASSKVVVGQGKLIDPSKLTKVFISPRTRAQRTYDLLFDDAARAALKEKVEITEDIREWEYGAYEGVTPTDIRKQRKEKGLDTERPWDIWHDGCEDGESPTEVATRLDELIAKIKQLQAPCMDGWRPADIVVIAHGHSLRAFAKRWIGFEMGMRLPLMLEPGAVGVLSYEHHRVDEPALLLGVNMGGEE